MDAVKEYEDVLVQNDKKIRRKAHREIKIALGESVEDESQEGELMNTDQLFQQAVFVRDSDSDRVKAKQAYDYLYERKNDLEVLEASIMEMMHLFQDMQMLVEQQGDLVDSIENNVKETMVHVEKSEKVLKEAEKTKVGIRKKKVMIGAVVAFIICFLCTVLLIVILIILFVTKMIKL